jgi:peptide/nickel transport system permease protein
VEAGRSCGCTDLWLLRRHVVPNVLPVTIIYATTNLGYAILAASTLSFLGVGVPPPAPTWGAMVSGEARTYMQQAPWLAIFPILALGLTIAGAAFLGDGLRDALDPRLRGR